MLLIPPSLPLVFVLSYPSSFNQPPYFQCPAVTGVSRELPRDRGSRKTHLSPSCTAFPTTFINPFESCKRSIHWTMNTPKKLDLGDINGAIECRFHQSWVLSPEWPNSAVLRIPEHAGPPNPPCWRPNPFFSDLPSSRDYPAPMIWLSAPQND